MTDIEKRAYYYAEAIYGDTEKDIEWSIARDGYEFCAKKQRKIDIEKACEAFCLVCTFECSESVSGKCQQYENFRKAMEGGEE